jgi:hypothetical protein
VPLASFRRRRQCSTLRLLPSVPHWPDPHLPLPPSPPLQSGSTYTATPPPTAAALITALQPRTPVNVPPPPAAPVIDAAAAIADGVTGNRRSVRLASKPVTSADPAARARDTKLRKLGLADDRNSCSLLTPDRTGKPRSRLWLTCLVCRISKSSMCLAASLIWC